MPDVFGNVFGAHSKLPVVLVVLLLLLREVEGELVRLVLGDDAGQREADVLVGVGFLVLAEQIKVEPEIRAKFDVRINENLGGRVEVLNKGTFINDVTKLGERGKFFCDTMKVELLV